MEPTAGPSAEPLAPASVPMRPGRLRFVLPLLVTVALVWPTARLLARWDWRADLLTHFAEPALAVTAVAAVVAAHRRRVSVLIGLVALAGWQGASLLTLRARDPIAPAPGRPERLRGLVANVYVFNDDHEALARLIERERPDFVGLLEVTAEWLEGLERLGIRSRFPHRRELPIGTSGLALWFREGPVHLSEPRAERLGDNPYLVATFPFAGQERRLVLVHPHNPIRSRSRAPGEIRALGAAVAGLGGSRIVAGDMNRTELSPHFGDFLAATGLRDSRQGRGRQPSWPCWSPYRLPIDHMFVSDDLAVTDRRLGPSIGSDHFPLLFELAPAR